MRRICYTVTATLPDENLAREYVDWLVGGHVQAVLAGGAIEARVVCLESGSGPVQVESAYLFPDRPAYESYVSVHAPRLRAEGLAMFGSVPGVAFARRVGTVRYSAAGISPPA